MSTTEDISRPLTPAQVARRFNVSVTTVANWADAGLLPSFRTPGGQRRFYLADVEAFIADSRPGVMTDLEPRLTSLEILRRDIAPNAPDEALEYFSKVCRRVGLDPWKDEITLVGRYDSRVKDTVWRPQIQIAGRRAIAERTGKLAGIEGPQWCGPRRYDDNGNRLPLDWSEVWDDDDAYPYAARVLVYRHDWDRPANGTVKWSEFAQFTTVNGQTRLTAAWQKMRSHMLGKVAESLALRPRLHRGGRRCRLRRLRRRRRPGRHHRTRTRTAIRSAGHRHPRRLRPGTRQRLRQRTRIDRPHRRPRLPVRPFRRFGPAVPARPQPRRAVLMTDWHPSMGPSDTVLTECAECGKFVQHTRCT